MQATQVLVVVLQTGVAPLQFAFEVHWTQTALVLPLVPEQIGVGLEQAEPVLPQMQRPLRHRLPLTEHSESARHPTAQVLLAVQYWPVGQCVCWVHCRQVLLTQEPLAQTFPHVPQLLGSLVMSIQTPALAQKTFGAVQLQEPLARQLPVGQHDW